jgi:hypothetical protein
MDKTFKEQVEEILCSHCGFKINNGFADRVDCESAKKLKECSTRYRSGRDEANGGVSRVRQTGNYP